MAASHEILKFPVFLCAGALATTGRRPWISVPAENAGAEHHLGCMHDGGVYAKPALSRFVARKCLLIEAPRAHPDIVRVQELALPARSGPQRPV